MPKYVVSLTKTAAKQLDKLPDEVAEMLLETIQSLASDPRPPGCKKLRGRDGHRKNVYQ